MFRCVALASLVLASLVLASIACGTSFAQETGKPYKTMPLWSDKAPGESKEYPAEGDTSKPNDRGVADRGVIRIGNVTQPDLRIYAPAPEKATGACVLVCPGGGYNILAYDLEGTEVCEWLNSIGVTAALLKYRVPRREGKPPYEAPLQDAQRALNVLRANASTLGLDPKRIGCLGFSAGGNLCTMLTTRSASLTYPKSDAADDLVPRPDFTLLIYPAYMVDKDNKQQLASDVVFTKDTPPMFLTMAQDDALGCENVLVSAMKLNELKVPFSLHLYPTGGHGYGLRKTGNPSQTWPDRAAEWMKQQGFLESKK
ncbi:MAG: alpha/beta hydrolase [Planctomycetota bacterium]|jgi:acetyl esterase/lipase